MEDKKQMLGDLALTSEHYKEKIAMQESELFHRQEEFQQAKDNLHIAKQHMKEIIKQEKELNELIKKVKENGK